MRLDEVSWKTHNERNFVQTHNAPVCVKTGNRRRTLKTETALQKRQRLYAQNIFKSVWRHPRPFLERGFIPVLATSFRFSTHRDLARFCSFLKSQMLTEQRVQELQSRTSSSPDSVLYHFLVYFILTPLHFFLRKNNFTSSNTAVILNFTAKNL